jgi:sugar (pentulose or hexulose) kinase
LRVAKKLLFMPDLFNYWLTGIARAERTIASTSQFYDPRKRAFASVMLKKLGLDPAILVEVVDPGTELGPLLPDIAEFSGLGAVPVYASGGHDTADAVVAVPAEGKNWCYISSGTWSLMGVELDAPVVDAATLAENFTNEAGAAGKIRSAAPRGLSRETISPTKNCWRARPPLSLAQRSSTRTRFWNPATCRRASPSSARPRVNRCLSIRGR